MAIAGAIVVMLLSFTHSYNDQTGSSGYGEDVGKSLEEQFVDPQNQARAACREHALVWDEEVAKYAAWYANCRRRDCALVHSNGTYGENLFWGSGRDWTPADAVADWLNETRWYNYEGNSCASGEMCGHYTQVVWNTTAKVGCARVVCDNNLGTFIICNYDPPGNFFGEKPY